MGCKSISLWNVLLFAAFIASIYYVSIFVEFEPFSYELYGILGMENVQQANNHGVCKHRKIAEPKIETTKSMTITTEMESLY